MFYCLIIAGAKLNKYKNGTQYLAKKTDLSS